MAVRFNASGESLSRARLSGARTLMGWFRIVTDRNDYTAFFGAGDNRLLGTDSDGTTLLFYDGAVEFTSTNLTVGTWYHLTLTLSSDASGGAFVAYLNGALSMNGNTSAADSGTTMYVANDAYGEWLNGNVAHVKLWSAALSAAEVQQEMYTVVPARSDNLVGWYPLDTHTDVSDWSGGGSNWTANGTLTTEDNPPVSWGGAIVFAPAVPASGPASQNAGVGVAEARAGGMAVSASPGTVTVIPGRANASVAGYAPAGQPGGVAAAVGTANARTVGAPVVAAPGSVTTAAGTASARTTGAPVVAVPGGLTAVVGTASAQVGGAPVAAAPGTLAVTVGRADVGITAYPVEATLSNTSQSVAVGLAVAGTAGYALSAAPGTITATVGQVAVGIAAYPVEASLRSQSVTVGLAVAGVDAFEIAAEPGVLVVAVGGALATVEGYAVDTARSLVVGVGTAAARGQGAPVVAVSGASLATAGTAWATVEGYAVRPVPGGIVAQVGLAVARAEAMEIAPGELAVTGTADVSDSATNLLTLAQWLRDDVWISDSAAGSVSVGNNQ